MDHPWFVRVAALASVIGIPLAFYVGKERKPHLGIYIDPVRTTIVQLGKISKFTVAFNGLAVTNDVSAAQLYIINTGEAPVRRDDILSPIISERWCRATRRKCLKL